ncbi:MAG: hypothetical protein ABR574_07870 [Cryomorphaceae bacterium]|nr:hypothetical protein [Flavobacteriales bacterium]
MKNTHGFLIRLAFPALAIILLMISACKVAESDKNREKSYNNILSETLLKKLLYNPDIINNLSFIADGENTFNNGDLSYNKDVTFYIRAQFIDDTARYDISNEELFITDYEGEIFIDHEGKIINQLREFSSFNFDEDDFFNSFKAIQSNYILLDENQSIEELEPNGILISFYKPDKTSNSIYQLIKMSNMSESKNIILTVSFSIDIMEWRSYSIHSSY